MNGTSSWTCGPWTKPWLIAKHLIDGGTSPQKKQTLEYKVEEVGISISLIKLEFCAKRAEVTGSVLVRMLRVLPPHCGYGLDSTPPPVILKCLRPGYREWLYSFIIWIFFKPSLAPAKSQALGVSVHPFFTARARTWSSGSIHRHRGIHLTYMKVNMFYMEIS